MELRIISVANQKGGIGKTTTAFNLGIGLSRQNRRVLLIDMDPQCNLTILCQEYIENGGKSIINIYEDDSSFKEIRCKMSETLDVIPGDKNLSGTEKASENGDEWILADKIEEVAEDYDYIIIDTPPIKGFLTNTSLLSSTDVVIPVQADLFSFQGIEKFTASIDKIKKRNNPDLRLMGVVITRYKKATTSAREMLSYFEDFCREHRTSILGIIPDNVAVNDASLNLKSVIEYDRSSAGAKAYASLADTVIGME